MLYDPDYVVSACTLAQGLKTYRGEADAEEEVAREEGREHLERDAHIHNHVGKEPPDLNVGAEVGGHERREDQPTHHGRPVARDPLQRRGQRRGA